MKILLSLELEIFCYSPIFWNFIVLFVIPCYANLWYSVALPFDHRRAPASNMSSIFDELLDSDALAEVDDGADITGGRMFSLFNIVNACMKKSCSSLFARSSITIVCCFHNFVCICEYLLLVCVYVCLCMCVYV